MPLSSSSDTIFAPRSRSTVIVRRLDVYESAESPRHWLGWGFALLPIVVRDQAQPWFGLSDAMSRRWVDTGFDLKQPVVLRESFRLAD